MELLDQLENSVSALMGKLKSLQAENESLKSEAGSAARFEAEIHSLRQELEEERRKNKAALARVNTIMQRIRALDD